MQKVHKQQAEGHKLAQYQLSNWLCAALEKQTEKAGQTEKLARHRLELFCPPPS